MSSPSRIFIRADASSNMGTGHVMRCLALAQEAVRQNIPVHLLVRAGVPWLLERLKREAVPYTLLSDSVSTPETPQTLTALLASAAEPHGKQDWVVLDGYHFGMDCQKAVRGAGYKLLVIDDYAHLQEYSCDILLNQNIGSEELAYAGDIGQKLLGPKYALLRQEFRATRQKSEARRFPATARNILLTLGGGDFSEDLARIAPYFAIPELTGCVLRVIAGTMPQERIQAALQSCPARMEILDRVGDMPGLLLDTDLCVTAGGSTCWELCCLGVPFLTVAIAENQRDTVKHLAGQGIGGLSPQSVLISLLQSCESRRRCAEIAKKLTSGLGALKVLGTIAAKVFYLREATMDDCGKIYELINEPEIRNMAASPHVITPEEHTEWYMRRMSHANSPFFLFFSSNIFLGYVRFDQLAAENSHTISIVVAQTWRGSGVGPAMLKRACLEFFSRGGLKAIATVRRENKFSASAFAAAGFSEITPPEDKSGLRQFVLALSDRNPCVC